MAGFCTSCGSPLPENGVCPCKAAQPQQPTNPNFQQPQQQPYQQQQYQQPYQQPYQQQQYQQPYQQQPYQQPYTPYPQQPVYPVRQGPSVFSNFFKVVGSYFKDPVGTSRSVLEKKDIASGALSVAACTLLALIGTLLFILVVVLENYTYYGYSLRDFGDYAIAWVIVGLFAPILAVGITFCVIYALTKLSKSDVDPIGLLSAIGINTLIPACLLAVSMVMSMLSSVIFEILAVMMFAAWIVGVFVLIFQVLNIKMSIVSYALLIAGITAAYYMIVMLLNWLVFNGDIVTYIGSLL